MTADDRPNRDECPAETPRRPRPAQEHLQTSVNSHDGSTEVDSAMMSSDETQGDDSVHVDPSFVALLEQFRDVTPAEDVFAPVKATTATSDTPGNIGRFQIIRQLGQGGYGVVFLARDPQLRRLVALKVPRPEVLVTASLRQRFLREAEAAAALNHANAVPVFESGHVGPLCYIASAYFAGPNLDQWVADQDGPILPHDAAHWVQQLAEAMQHAHLRGVLHRDLKPSNVLMSRNEPIGALAGTEKTWIPRVTDFGLARLAEATGDQTRTNAILGTPSYMAPEQASGQVRQTGPATDIYGLGAILYFLLTKRPPLEAETPMATLQAVVTTEPTRPSRIQLDVPRDLEAICLQCLEKSPEKRYASASQLAADLQRFLDGEPVRARRITSWERAARWCRRNPALATLAATLLITLTVATAGMSRLWWEARAERRRADQRAAQLDARTRQLQRAMDRLFSAMADTPEMNAIGAEPLRRACWRKCKTTTSSLSANNPTTRRCAKRMRTRCTDWPKSMPCWATRARRQNWRGALQEISQADTNPHALIKQRAAWQQFLGNQQFRLGQFETARRTYRKLLESVEQGSQQGLIPAEEKQRVLALALTDLARAELYAADMERAHEAAEQAYSHWQGIGFAADVHPDHDILLDYANCLRTLGQVHEAMRNLPDSEEYFRQAIQVMQPHVDAGKSDDLKTRALIANCRQGLGIAIAQQDRFDEARQQYLQSMAIFEQLVAAHPLVISYREDLCGAKYSLAVTQLLTQHYDEAAQLIGEIINEFEGLSEQYPDQRLTLLDRSGKDYNLLYVIRSRQKNWDAAREAIEAGLRCFDTVLAERPDWLETRIAQAELTGNYGNLLSNLEDYDAALSKYQLARELILAITEQQPDHARARQTLISSFTGPVAVYTKRKQYDLALSDLRKALEIRRDERMIDDLLHEVWLLDRLDRFEEAQGALESFLARFGDSAEPMRAAAKKASELVELHVADDTSAPDEDSSGEPPPGYLQQLKSLAASAASDEERDAG